MKPYCSACVVFREKGRRANRAVYLALWVTGEGAWLCRLHAEGCKRGGGVVWPLPKGLECEEGLSPSEMLERLHVASIARRDTVSMAEIERAVREALPAVLMRLLQVGASAGGLSPPGKERSPEIEAPGIASAFE